MTHINVQIKIPEALHKEASQLKIQHALTWDQLFCEALDHYLDVLVKRQIDSGQTPLKRWEKILSQYTPEQREALRKKNEELSKDPAIQAIEREAAEFDKGKVEDK